MKKVMLLVIRSKASDRGLSRYTFSPHIFSSQLANLDIIPLVISNTLKAFVQYYSKQQDSPWRPGQRANQFIGFLVKISFLFIASDTFLKCDHIVIKIARLCVYSNKILCHAIHFFRFLSNFFKYQGKHFRKGTFFKVC